MGYLVYKHKNFMFSEATYAEYSFRLCQLPLPPLPSAVACHPLPVAPTPVLPCPPPNQTCHVLSMRVTPLTPPATPHLGSHLTCSQCHSRCSASLAEAELLGTHSMAVWPSTVLPAAPQKGHGENDFVCYQLRTAPLHGT